MVQVIYKYFILLAILMLVSSTSLAQEKFWNKIDFDLSYTNVDGWLRIRGTSGDIKQNHDGFALGAAVNYHLNDKVFFQFQYQRANLLIVDFNAKMNLGFFDFIAGRKFAFIDKSILTIKGGMAILNKPTYATWTIVHNGIKNVQRVFWGTEGFRHWTAGGELTYPLSNEVTLGGSLDIYFTDYSNTGFTNSSIFLRLKVFN